MKNRPSFIESTRIKTVPDIRHGFFTRHGGVSTGPFTSLNCGYTTGDDKNSVTQNRSIACNALGENLSLCTVHQVHGYSVVRAQKPWPPSEAPQADALVTTTPGLALGMLTADCAPVIFACTSSGAIGIAHAGWRGAIAGVLEATVEALQALGATPNTLHVAIGPCIAQKSYEVDNAFHQQFLEQSQKNAAFFNLSDAGTQHFDLKAYCASRLAGCGINTIDVLPHDTYADEANFYSHRRATHRSEPHCGRMLSLIAKAP